MNDLPVLKFDLGASAAMVAAAGAIATWRSPMDRPRYGERKTEPRFSETRKQRRSRRKAQRNARRNQR